MAESHRTRCFRDTVYKPLTVAVLALHPDADISLPFMKDALNSRRGIFYKK